MPLRFAVWLSLMPLLIGCISPAALPRSAEVARVGGGSVELKGQLMSVEPQTVTYDHGSASSALAIIPAPVVAARIGFVPRCEIGGSLPLIPVYPGHYVGELRCALLTPRESVIAIAPSAAGGALAGLGLGFPGWWGRAGIDASARVGSITPMLGAYVSRGPELHYITLPDTFGGTAGKFVPPDGPLPVSESVVRVETRWSFPIGLGITTWEDRDVIHRAVLGVVPWWVNAPSDTSCDAPCRSYAADHGVSIVVGFEAAEVDRSPVARDGEVSR
jgi:hypothetical protein